MVSARRRTEKLRTKYVKPAAGLLQLSAMPFDGGVHFVMAIRP